ESEYVGSEELEGAILVALERAHRVGPRRHPIDVPGPTLGSRQPPFRPLPRIRAHRGEVSGLDAESLIFEYAGVGTIHPLLTLKRCLNVVNEYRRPDNRVMLERKRRGDEVLCG